MLKWKFKNKIISKLTLVFVISITSFLGILTLRLSLADNFTANAKCVGNSTSITATAPASVTQGSTFDVTNVSSTSSAPAGLTINKIVSNTTVTNATPSSLSGTWNGVGVGTFTSNFPDVSLTANGPVGSQVTMNLISNDLYINGSTTPATCSVANGLLVNVTPGQPITLITVNITAAASQNTSTSNLTTTTTNGVSKSTSSTSKPKTNSETSQSTSTSTNSQTVTSSDLTSTDGTGHIVNLTLTDAANHALSNVSVSIDSQPVIYTNSKGKAIFSNISSGNHKLYVWNGKVPIVRTITLSPDDKAPLAITIKLPKQKSWLPVVAIIIGLTSLIVASTWMFLHLKNNKIKIANQLPIQSTTDQKGLAITQSSAVTSSQPVLTTPNSAPQIISPGSSPSSQLESKSTQEPPSQTTPQIPQI